ncbi:MAG: PQQ-binding-like beta-propeller repeat protein [Planctomycetaceae bacterium]
MPQLPRIFAALLLLATTGRALHAGDWPQILGPHRNGIAGDDEKLADRWPAGGPPVVWSLPVGQGFAGPAVVGDRVLVFDRRDSEERLFSVQTSDGGEQWMQAWPTSFVPLYGRDDGPMCVPAVADGAVVALGAEGQLSCFDLATGKVRWRHDTKTEFDPLEGYFGAGSSPLIDGGTVYVIVGGRSQKAGIVAFDLVTGDVRWKAVEDGASYSSPVIAAVGGKPRLVALTRFKCSVLDPASGTVDFEFPYGVRSPSVTAANPLMIGDAFFLSASYGIGARLVGFDGVQRWESNDLMSSQYTTCVAHDGLLYGIDGRQDIPPATLRCFDPITQNVVWSKENFGYATLIKADGKLLIMKTNGEFVLAQVGGDAYRELARTRLFADANERNNPVRALPALSNGRFYARDSRTLKCVDLRAAN